NSTVTPAPLAEDVEGGAAVPAGWTLANPDGSTTWQVATLAQGAGCSSTKAWTINYYAYAAPGQEDALVTPGIDLAASAGTHLTFDHAYARYSADYYDGFRVDISSDCGSSWTTLYQAAGSTLATASDNTSGNWEPANCSRWPAHDIDLSPYDGPTIRLRFVGICSHRQRLHMGNANVAGTGATSSVRMYLEGCSAVADNRMC